LVLPKKSFGSANIGEKVREGWVTGNKPIFLALPFKKVPLLLSFSMRLLQETV